MDGIKEKINSQTVKDIYIEQINNKESNLTKEYPLDSMEIDMETDVTLLINQRGIKGNVKFILHSLISNLLILRILPFVGRKSYPFDKKNGDDGKIV